MKYNIYVYKDSLDEVPVGLAFDVDYEDLDDYIKAIASDGYDWELEEIE